MKDKLVLDSLDAIRALSDPRRLDLIKELVGAPMTAAELAEAIGEDKSKLYYHIGELEKQGLVEVVETRQKRNFLEKVYRATARFYTVDRSLFSGEHGMEVFYETVTSILDATASDIHRLIQGGRLHGENVEEVSPGHRKLLLGDRREEFVERLEELIRDFSAKEGGEGDHMLSFVLYPRAGK